MVGVDDFLLVVDPAFFWNKNSLIFHQTIIHYFFLVVFGVILGCFVLMKVSAASFTNAQAMMFMLMAIKAASGTMRMLTPRDWLKRAKTPAMMTETTAIAR